MTSRILSISLPPLWPSFFQPNEASSLPCDEDLSRCGVLRACCPGGRGRFTAHRVEKHRFIPHFKVGDFDWIGFRRKASRQPGSDYLLEGIARAHRARHRLSVKLLDRPKPSCSPSTRGWNHNFSFSGDASPFPLGNSNETQLAETAHTGLSTYDLVVHSRNRKNRFERAFQISRPARSC